MRKKVMNASSRMHYTGLDGFRVSPKERANALQVPDANMVFVVGGRGVRMRGREAVPDDVQRAGAPFAGDAGGD